MRPIYLLVGVPCSGKSTIAEQLTELYDYVPHDDYIKDQEAYLEAILEASAEGTAPVLAETPFSISQIMDPLIARRREVVPVFIIEDPDELVRRYLERNGRPIPPGHLTRNKTYAARAAEYNAFAGTADEVLEHLRSLCEQRASRRSKSR